MKIGIRRSIALVGALAVLPIMTVSAHAGTPGALSADTVAAMTPERQAEVLGPLRLAADAVAQVGRGARADVYTQVELASDYRSVNVYLTDVAQGRDFLSAVRKTNPKADTGLIHIVRGKKSAQQLKKEIAEIADRKDLPFKVALAGSTPDGGSIQLAVDDPASARGYFASPAVTARRAAGAATAVQVTQAPPSRPLTRENDTSPFYAGAALGPNIGGQAHCTSGIPAVSTWDGRQWLVTAGHCHNVNDNVYTMGGNYIGQVKYKLPAVDSAFIEAPTNRYTWDGLDATGYTRYLNGVRNVAVGDFTCQLGYNTKVFCNIRTVYAGNASWNVNGTTVNGSYGVPHYGGIVGRGGDSGGPVITINDQNSRQLNGIVSYGYGCNASQECSTGLAWVDVWSIFNAFAIKLNPS
ncbi:S1 family peptidase [Streptomyces sp. NBC_00536]|uniref:hypothetical protein n=1 Tax=Streptomyces sp. NBC_00536 TaxID=2975769 RepID=UPI002E80DED4|nr:hypothetical protein [Streptomyces sp. NBC_00536]WUC82759.1 S1 family peptidase [Streptomyces sp. NBC_00536]